MNIPALPSFNRAHLKPTPSLGRLLQPSLPLTPALPSFSSCPAFLFLLPCLPFPAFPAASQFLFARCTLHKANASPKAGAGRCSSTCWPGFNLLLLGRFPQGEAGYSSLPFYLLARAVYSRKARLGLFFTLPARAVSVYSTFPFGLSLSLQPFSHRERFQSGFLSTRPPQ